MLALRSSQTLPEDPMAALKDYFGTIKSPEWDEVTKYEEGIEQFKEENVKLQEEIEALEIEKERLLEEKRQKEIREQQQLAEEEAKKAKKGGKK